MHPPCRRQARAPALPPTALAFHLAGLVPIVLLLLLSPARAEKVLHRGNLAEPYSLDPHHTTQIVEANIMGDILLGLYTEGADGNPVPGAAESAETSPDGLTWTFRLRDHQWSDGVPVTAGDFVFTFRRLMNPATAAEYANVLYPIKNAQAVNKGRAKVEQLGVRAVDARTLVIELEHPAAYLPELLMHQTAYPVPRKLVEANQSGWTRPGTMPSNGAYVLAEWRPHDHIKLVKNPKFYDAANVKIDAVYFYPIDDDLAALKRYRAGELDTQERWPVAMHDWLSKNVPDEARRATALWTQYISFNTTRKPFDDVRVRKALGMALDRQAVLKDIFSGNYGEEALNVLPPGTVNVDRSAVVEWAGKTMEERRAEARRLLAQAGFGPNKPLRFTYNYSSTVDNKRIAVAYQDMWKQIGAVVELAATEAKVHQKVLQTHDFDVAADGWILDYNDAKNQLYLFQGTTVEMNYSSYRSSAYDGFLDAADREPDGAKRAKLLGQASAQLLADMPVVPSFFPYQRQLIKSYVKNWVVNPRRINRTRWLDIADTAGSVQTVAGTEGAAGSEGGFWSWLASWFDGAAWRKWWNS